MTHPAGDRRHAAPPTACEHPLRLSASLIAEAKKPFSHPGDNAIPDQVFCEVQRGHDGPHLAQIQAFGDDEAWAQWATGNPAAIRYFSDETLCEARGRDAETGEEDALCALPGGHHGQHTFSLRHVHSAGRDPSPEHAAKLAQMTEDRP
jgi:hypothetical protein